MDDRVPTGIEGFDEVIGGGLPRGRSILISGTCGTGKTTFALQFLVNGIVNHGETGILVTLEQNAQEIRDDMLSFGMDLKKFEEDGKLIIIDTSLSKIGLKDYLTTLPSQPQKSFSLLPDEFDLDKIVDLIVEASDEIGAKRVVIDSLPALDYILKDIHDIRRALINMNYVFKSKGLTSLAITESLEGEALSKHQVEEYITDGVIVLHTNEALDTRTLRVRKMRKTDHTLKSLTFEFGETGLIVKSPKSL